VVDVGEFDVEVVDVVGEVEVDVVVELVEVSVVVVHDEFARWEIVVP
jgi:hypothetical protein